MTEAPKENESTAEVSNGVDAVEEEPCDDLEFRAWNELRLHPIIMKSMYKLGFKEPTPIQKACIPAAAHQGKDVVGASETGSGKTLAFGLPIFQRLLEEREKVERLRDKRSGSREMCPNWCSKSINYYSHKGACTSGGLDPICRPRQSEMELFGMDFGCVIGALSDGHIPAKDCLLPLLSKLLGYAIVAASTTVKLPQIMKILQNRSIRGLSVVAFELETIGYTIALAYCLHKGLPFSAYGELAFLLIQAIILVAILYYYSQPMGIKSWIRPLIYCAIAPTILAGQIDPVLFEALYASQHAIFFSARVPQIWKNYTSKSTGQLSFLTSFMNFSGSMVRVFTSIQEKTPMSVVLGSVIGILTNGTILSQILLYSKQPSQKEKKMK